MGLLMRGMREFEWQLFDTAMVKYENGQIFQEGEEEMD